MRTIIQSRSHDKDRALSALDKSETSLDKLRKGNSCLCQEHTLSLSLPFTPGPSRRYRSHLDIFSFPLPLTPSPLHPLLFSALMQGGKQKKRKREGIRFNRSPRARRMRSDTPESLPGQIMSSPQSGQVDCAMQDTLVPRLPCQFRPGSYSSHEWEEWLSIHVRSTVTVCFWQSLVRVMVCGKQLIYGIIVFI